MRTSVDLPPAVRRRAESLAAARGQSLSVTIVELTMRGLAQPDEPVRIAVEPRSGFPARSFGARITAEDVAAGLDED